MLGLRHNQGGDTIVEVMIAIAIVSLVLVTAYVTTNHNTLTLQDTQERSQALQLAQSQVEFLHNANLGVGDTCFDPTDGTSVASTGVTNDDPCVVSTGGGEVKSSDTEPQYHVAITTAVAGSLTTYKVAVTWDSLVQSSRDNVTLYYQR